MHCEGHLRAQIPQNMHFSISLNSAPRTLSKGVLTSRGYRRVAFLENKFLSTFGVILNMAYLPIYPNVAKVGGLQSQGVKGEVVVVYHDPLTTQDLKSSGFSVG
jgi:hypothetical protein